MLNSVNIKTGYSMPLTEFLESNDFLVEQITEKVCKVTRPQELPVFMHLESDGLYFEVDLGNVSGFSSEELYYKFLDLNTEILPVSIGIDSTNADDPRVVLVESRETRNLDDNELLSVFNALELATDKVEALLSQYVK